MNIQNLNLIYTFIPPKNEWIYNRNFYIVDLESLCLSVLIIKNNFRFKQIKLYTTKFFSEFFKKTELFDVIIDIEKISNDLKKIDTTQFKTNTLYKLFVPSLEIEPFIHIDHDMFINDETIFEKIDKNIFFSFPEDPYLNGKLHHFYGFYIDVLDHVKKNVNENIFNNFSQKIAYNCSIFGCTNETLISSFTQTKDFFIKNFEKIVLIDRIDCFLEQFFQINFINSTDIFTFEDIIQKDGRICDFDLNSKIIPENLDQLKYEFEKRKMIHISGDRYTTYYRNLIPELLYKHDKELLFLMKKL